MVGTGHELIMLVGCDCVIRSILCVGHGYVRLWPCVFFVGHCCACSWVHSLCVTRLCVWETRCVLCAHTKLLCRLGLCVMWMVIWWDFVWDIPVGNQHVCVSTCVWTCVPLFVCLFKQTSRHRFLLSAKLSHTHSRFLSGTDDFTVIVINFLEPASFLHVTLASLERAETQS